MPDDVLTVLSLDAVMKISFSCAQAQSQMMRAWALSALIVLYPSVVRQSNGLGITSIMSVSFNAYLLFSRAHTSSDLWTRKEYIDHQG